MDLCEFQWNSLVCSGECSVRAAECQIRSGGSVFPVPPSRGLWRRLLILTLYHGDDRAGIVFYFGFQVAIIALCAKDFGISLDHFPFELRDAAVLFCKLAASSKKSNQRCRDQDQQKNKYVDRNVECWHKKIIKLIE
jgi:hypothetical protein